MDTRWDDAFAFLDVLCEASITEEIENDIVEAKGDLAKAFAEHTHLHNKTEVQCKEVSDLENAASASKVRLPELKQKEFALELQKEQNSLKLYEADEFRERANIEMCKTFIRYRELQKKEAELKSEHKAVQFDRKRLQTDRDVILENIKSTKREIKGLEVELEALNSKLPSAKGTNFTPSDTPEAKIARAQIPEVNSKLTTAKSKLSAKKAEMKTLKGTAKSAKAAVYAIETQLREIGPDVHSAKSEWEAARDRHQDAVNELQKILQSVKKENKKIDVQLNELATNSNSDFEDDFYDATEPEPGPVPAAAAEPEPEPEPETKEAAAEKKAVELEPAPVATKPEPNSGWIDWFKGGISSMLPGGGSSPPAALPNPTTASSWDDAFDFLGTLTMTNVGDRTSEAEMNEESPLQEFNDELLLELANRVYATIMEDPTAVSSSAITKELEDKKYNGVKPSGEYTDRIMRNIDELIAKGREAVASVAHERTRNGNMEKSELVVHLISEMRSDPSGVKSITELLQALLNKHEQFRTGLSDSCADAIGDLLNGLMYYTYNPDSKRTAELYPLDNNSQLLKGLGVSRTQSYFDKPAVQPSELSAEPFYTHTGCLKPYLQLDGKNLVPGKCLERVEENSDYSAYYTDMLGNHEFEHAHRYEKVNAVNGSKYLVLVESISLFAGIDIRSPSFESDGQTWVLHAGAFYKGDGNNGHYWSFTYAGDGCPGLGQYRVYSFGTTVKAPDKIEKSFWTYEEIMRFGHVVCTVYVREQYKHKVPLLYPPRNLGNTCWLSAAMVVIASMYEGLFDSIISQTSGSSAASMASFRGRRRAPCLKKITGLKRRRARARAPPPPRHRAGSVVDLTGQARLYKGA